MSLKIPFKSHKYAEYIWAFFCKCLENTKYHLDSTLLDANFKMQKPISLLNICTQSCLGSRMTIWCFLRSLSWRLLTPATSTLKHCSYLKPLHVDMRLLIDAGMPLLLIAERAMLLSSKNEKIPILARLWKLKLL